LLDVQVIEKTLVAEEEEEEEEVVVDRNRECHGIFLPPSANRFVLDCQLRVPLSAI
jgi:hypothetical protein